jgi:crotonobetainyl-CoA:carnitine CoA-transferase CaiB-like acyl-CoA transferase
MKTPLEGIRILDLSILLAGPFGTMILGDLGAEVIKIERPPKGDSSRYMPPHFIGGESAYYLSMNRNKKSMTLDLKKPEGIQIFRDLVRKADVVWDNFRPGVMERLGIDYARLREINPKIIACSVSGFGQNGPYRERPAFDLVVQAMGGVMSYTGEEDGTPVRMGAPLGDLGGGIFGAMGVLAALQERERTGVGQMVDVAMLDVQISLQIYRALYYWLSGEIPTPVGAGHVSAVPIDLFRTADHGVVIDANTEEVFARLCNALGRPEWITDPNFKDRMARWHNKKQLLTAIQNILLTKTRAEWMEILIEHEVPCGPVNSVADILNDRHVLERPMMVTTQHPTAGPLKLLASPMKFPAHGELPVQPPPLLGEHTSEVLAGWLGLDAERLQALKAKGIT